MVFVRDEQRIECPNSAADRDTGRSYDPSNDAFRSHPFRYSQIELTASPSSAPSARTSKLEPCAAASKRMLRILRASASAPGSRSLRSNTIEDLYCPASWTTRAAALAWSPRRWPTTTSRSITVSFWPAVRWHDRCCSVRFREPDAQQSADPGKRRPEPEKA